MEIELKVIEIFEELTDLEDIELDYNIQEDLNLDSLVLVTMILQVEDVFGIQLDESDMNPFDLTTVGDVVNLVKKYIGGNDEE